MYSHYIGRGPIASGIIWGYDIMIDAEETRESPLILLRHAVVMETDSSEKWYYSNN